MGCLQCCEKGRRKRGLISGYYEVLTRWPGLVLGVVLMIFVVIFIVIAFNLEYLKVTDASKGVEARQTELSGRAISLKNLFKSDELSVIPKINGNVSNTPLQIPPSYENNCTTSNWFKMLKIIIEPVEEDGNLLDVDHLKSLCTLRNKLIDHHHVDRTCGMVSILDVLKDVTGATCGDIKPKHVEALNEAISSCMAHYISGITAGQPEVCKVVFDIFFYFSDVSFSSGQNNIGNYYPLRRSLVMVLLNDAPDSSIAKEYHADVLDRTPLTFGHTSIRGIDSAVKPQVFERYLFIDLTWMVVAFLLVAVVIMIYLKSVVMAIVTAVNIGLSLTIAYFFYLIVLRIKFFPFLNLLSSVILIALAADDVFLFSETWQIMKKRFPRGSLEDNMTLTFRHAGMSVLVTSVTTATSFFSNHISNVTSIKCFGVYAGLCIIANYLLMCTFIPAVMILLEKSNCTKCSKMETPKCVLQLCDKVSQASDYVFGRAFFYMVNKLYPLLILLFLALGIGSAIVVYYYPKLSLPQDGRFRGFVSSHPLEVYDDLIGSFKFVQNGDFSLPLYYVWGVKPVDNGNPMDPDDNGELVFDYAFSIEVPKNQYWLADFCKNLRKSPYIMQNNATVCTMELYLESLAEPCEDVTQTCCDNRDTKFNKCFPDFMAKLYATTPIQNIAGIPYFDEDNTVKAFIVNYTSIQGFVTDYDTMDKFYNNITSQLNKALEYNAPVGVSQVFVDSYFTYYDAQKALIRGTFESVGISLAVTFGCVLITTRNILVSIYSIINIAQAIHVTVACLVLLGWTLNVTESIIISLAVGLTIDFVIHFGVAYMLSYEMTREKRVHEVLSTVGSPATMAAFTTFLAGAAMMPATVYCYQQLGIFLVFVMVISLAYALFFFLPVCRWIGPLGSMMQIPLPFCFKDSNKEDQTYSSNSTSTTNSYTSTKSNSLEHSPRNSEKSSNSSSFTNIDSIIHGSRRQLLDRTLPTLSSFQDSQSHLYREYYSPSDPLGPPFPHRPHHHHKHHHKHHQKHHHKHVNNLPNKYYNKPYPNQPPSSSSGYGVPKHPRSSSSIYVVPVHGR